MRLTVWISTLILKTELLAHQAAAVAKLSPIRVGALFMEMGTGKSRTAIELAHRRGRKISRVVWFTPVSLKATVAGEIRKHTDASASDIHVFDHKTAPHNLPDCYWYVVGIESMSASDRVILTIAHLVDPKTMVIVDESSYIKGHRSARTCWITDLSEKARYRLILTGTPISQGVVDLFAQMRFLSPKILGYTSFYSFSRNHLEYSDKFPGLIVAAHNEAYLAAKIKPYVYQVTKKECMTLPSKMFERRYFEMTLEQRDVYEDVKTELFEVMMTDDFSSYDIFRLFTALQKIVSGFHDDPDSGRYKFEHARIDTLLDVIRDIPKNEKIIIWAKYEYDILAITEALGDGVCQYYGQIKETERHQQVQRFRNDARFFVATQSCGGHGLTLNEAHYVIFYNNGFKYSERVQAEDRCHRYGQTEPVTYIDLICVDSIDERIQGALYGKANVVQAFKREVEKIKKEGGEVKI